MHLVAADETLAAIAKRYGVPVAGIVAANRLAGTEAEQGDRLLIPAAAHPAPAMHAAARKVPAHRPVTPAAAVTRRPRPAPAKTTAAVARPHKPSTIVASAAHQ
jgi:LysM repeat protein